MSIFKEIGEDIKFTKSVLLEKAKSEFTFNGENGPIVAIPGVGGGWNKNGLRKYMNQNDVGGILVYLGNLDDGLDKHIESIIKYIDSHPDSIILGYSAGGILALKYAERYGWNNFKKIITIATPFFGSPPAEILKFAGKTYSELSPNSEYLKIVRDIKPPDRKVISIFSKQDLKAPFSNTQSLNWPYVVVDSNSHGQIHSNYKFIEPILNRELGISPV